MKTTLNSILVRFITLLMVAVMGVLIANKAVFLHVHKLNDGTYIEHAHPFDKKSDSTPFKSHTHSEGQFLLFQVLETIFFLFFIALTLVALVKREIVYLQLSLKSKLVFANCNKGRSPPIL